MKTLRSLIFSLLILPAFAAISTAISPGPAYGTGEPAVDSGPVSVPKMIIGSSTHDFGTVLQGTPVQHSFSIQNSGEAPLKIEHIHTACGCTAAVLDSDTIQPKQKTELRVTFDTNGFQGAKVKTVRIYTNDPKQSSALFTLQGTVEPDIDVSRQRLHFGEIRRGDKPSLEVTVSASKNAAASGTEIKIGDVTTRSEFLQLSVTPESGEHSRKKIVLTLKENIPIGVFRDRVVVKTTSKNNPVINIPVFAKVNGDIRVEPPVVSFGLLDGPLESSVSQLIRVKSQNGRATKVRSVSSDLSGLVADVVGFSDDGETTIRVVVRAEVVGVFRANLSIKTDSEQEGESELSVPVYGIVSKKSE